LWTEAATICGDVPDESTQRFLADRVRLRDSYLKWMEETSLSSHADNWKRYNAVKKWDIVAQPSVLCRLPEEINGTELPDPKKHTGFKW
jgi:hypothetical protein